MSRILVVEPEASLRRLYERDLARDGDVILTADDAISAVREFELEHPDIVVLDLGPQPNDGLRVVERMFAVDRTIPIVLNTMCRSYADEPLGWAVDAYVVKSSDTSELRSKVKELLCSRSSGCASHGQAHADPPRRGA
jgi:DNA-binding response OmpR family regulator